MSLVWGQSPAMAAAAGRPARLQGFLAAAVSGRAMAGDCPQTWPDWTAA
jgi:hypothetical protein